MRTISILWFAGLMLLACSLLKPQDRSDTVAENPVQGATATVPEPEPTSRVSAESANDSTFETEGSQLPTPASGVFGEASVAPLPYLGAASLEERILRYPTIVRAMLNRVTTETIKAGGYWEGKYVNIARFHLTVSEYLNGSGGTNIVAVWGSAETYDSQGDAENARATLTDDRDTQWDDVEAVFLLKNEPWEMFNAAKATDTYYTAEGGDFSGDDYMSIGSRYVRLWLPTAPTSTGSGDDKRFLLEAQVEPSTISLGDLKAKIAAINAEINAGDGTEAYRKCVAVKYLRLRLESHAQLEGRKNTSRAEDVAHIMEAGAPASTVIYEDEAVGDYPDRKTSTTWLEGRDAALFEVIDGTTFEPWDSNYDGDLEAGVDWIRYQQMLRNVRPLPGGTYTFNIKDLGDIGVPCNDVLTHEWTVTVTTLNGVLHELFFDPVTLRQAQSRPSAVGADGTNGVLKLAAFTDGNGRSATISSISYEAGTVELGVTPGDALADQIADIIELDGTVSLSLDVADATVDPSTGSGQAGTLSWSVSTQPWEDGDLLMVRIREGR